VDKSRRIGKVDRCIAFCLLIDDRGLRFVDDFVNVEFVFVDGVGRKPLPDLEDWEEYLGFGTFSNIDQ
jgi:hypothetical protein